METTFDNVPVIRRAWKKKHRDAHYLIIARAIRNQQSASKIIDSSVITKLYVVWAGGKVRAVWRAVLYYNQAEKCRKDSYNNKHEAKDVWSRLKVVCCQWYGTNLDPSGQGAYPPGPLQKHVDGEGEDVAYEGDGFKGANRQRYAVAIHIPKKKKKTENFNHGIRIMIWYTK